MISEQREKAERQDDPHNLADLKEHLMHYLRDKYDERSLASSYTCRATEKLLAGVAKDFDLKRGITRGRDEYTQIARGAITHFLNDHDGRASNGGNRLGMHN